MAYRSVERLEWHEDTHSLVGVGGTDGNAGRALHLLYDLLSEPAPPLITTYSLFGRLFGSVALTPTTCVCQWCDREHTRLFDNCNLNQAIMLCRI